MPESEDQTILCGVETYHLLRHILGVKLVLKYKKKMYVTWLFYYIYV